MAITLTLPNGIVGDGMFSHAILVNDESNIKYDDIEIYGITLDAGTTGMSLGKRSKKHPYAWRIYAGAGAATEGTYTVTVDYLDAEGTTSSVSATGSITKDGDVPPDDNDAVLSSVSLAAMPDGKVGTIYQGSTTATCNEADDGTYLYQWSTNGSGTGLGYLIAEDGTHVDSDEWYAFNTVFPVNSSYQHAAPTKAGSPYITCTVKDSAGTTKQTTVWWDAV